MCRHISIVPKCLSTSVLNLLALDEPYMGRVDAILDDKLEQRFRLEVAKRYGLRKGNIGRAVSEAIEMWSASDETRAIARKAAKSVRNPNDPIGVKQHAVHALASLGAAGRELLADIASDSKVPDSIREQAWKAVSAQTGR